MRPGSELGKGARQKNKAAVQERGAQKASDRARGDFHQPAEEKTTKRAAPGSGGKGGIQLGQRGPWAIRERGSRTFGPNDCEKNNKAGCSRAAPGRAGRGACSSDKEVLGQYEKGALRRLGTIESRRV